MTQRIGFIGTGVMASSIIKRLVASGYPASQIMCSDPDVQRTKELTMALGTQFTSDNVVVGPWARLCVLSVKPHLVRCVLDEIAPAIKGKAVISIAAGITTAQLKEWAGEDVRVLRAMPNTPAQIGSGVTVFSKDHTLSDDELALATKMFESVGSVMMLEERLMNAVTVLSGSGPALPYTMIEIMADAGVRMGLPRKAALELSIQTVVGAAHMIMETQRHPAALRDEVCSPGGSTIEMVAALEAHGFQNAIHQSLARCLARVEHLAES